MPCGAFNFNFYKKNFTNSQNYLSFPRVIHFSNKFQGRVGRESTMGDAGWWMWFLRYGRNVFSQSDSKIFNTNIFLEQNDQKTWFFAWWYIFLETKSWVKNIVYGCGHSCPRTLKLAVSQKGISGRNWFFTWWYKCTKTESYCTSYWVGSVENVRNVSSQRL